MPLPTKPTGLPSAVNDLGLGDMLGQQVGDETAEQRRKRMQQIQDTQRMGAAGSPANLALIGGLGGIA